MTLGELLTLLRESILNDRSDRTAGTSDYLWTDTTLVTYINEAQRQFAVQGLVLRDGVTDEVTKVTLVEGQTRYTLHESVLAVVSAKLEDLDSDLARVGHSALGEYRAPSETWVDPASYIGLPPGQTLAWSTDETLSSDNADDFSQMVLRVYPAPSADQDGDEIRLRVVRKPLEPLRVGNLDMSPEIPEDHHIEMLDWAAYLALRIVDDDAGAAKRATEFMRSFEAHVARARSTAMRKLFAPIPWGFGRGGFTWSS